VACRAVLVHSMVTDRPMFSVGQSPPRGSSSSLNRAFPPLHSSPSAGPDSGNPPGPSTLCGSHWMAPQLSTSPLAHSICLLGGWSTYPGALTTPAVSTDSVSAAVPLMASAVFPILFRGFAAIRTAPSVVDHMWSDPYGLDQI